MEIIIKHRGDMINVPVKTTGFVSRGIGLTFRSRNTSNLLFDFSKPVTFEGTLTSIFVFFDFLAIWLDKNNNVVDYKIIKPFTFSIIQRKKFYKILELPVNVKNRKIIGKFTDNRIIRR